MYLFNLFIYLFIYLFLFVYHTVTVCLEKAVFGKLVLKATQVSDSLHSSNKFETADFFTYHLAAQVSACKEPVESTSTKSSTFFF